MIRNNHPVRYCKKSNRFVLNERLLFFGKSVITMFYESVILLKTVSYLPFSDSLKKSMASL